MSQDSIQHWAFIAWSMAWITVIASIILVVVYGEVDVITHSRLFGPQRETVINWPLIVGLVASSIYAFLFAVIMSALHRSVSLGEDVLDELRAMRGNATAGETAGAVSPDGSAQENTDAE